MSRVRVYLILFLAGCSPFIANAEWTAYNDCVYRSEDHPYLADNVTVYGVGVGFDGQSSGKLKDLVSGADTSVTVTLSQAGGVYWQSDLVNGGSDTAAGTDAHDIFSGIAGMQGVIYYGAVGWYVDVTFSGLDLSKQYTFAASANRGNPGYSNRWTVYTIIGADTFENTSSNGVDIISKDQARFNTGDNFDAGYVVRFSGVTAADGSFTVRAQADPASENGYKAYSFDVFMLSETGDAENHAPIVDAGDDISVIKYEDPGNVEIKLSAEVSDDSRPWTDPSDPGSYAGLTYTWTAESVPEGASVDFLPSANVPDPNVVLDIEGTYSFIVTVDDSELSSADDVNITVQDYEPTYICPAGDLDGDCFVDIIDLNFFADAWLDIVDCYGSLGCPDLDNDESVGFGDYALASENWQKKVTTTVYISEFMAANEGNLSTVYQPGGEPVYPDWIEIHNAGPEKIDIGQWYLTDNLSKRYKWQFPERTYIDPGGYLVVFASGRDDMEYPFIDAGGYYHTNFKLDKNGEYLGLINSRGQIVHQFISYEYAATKFGYPLQREDCSYGASDTNASNLRYYTAPTPGQENAAGYIGFVDNVQFSAQRGFYETPTTVMLSTATEGASIRYTIDGSTPSASEGTLFDGSPVSIDATTCLRTIAYKDDWLSSEVVTHTYIFVDDVIDQSADGYKPGPGWPDPGTSSVNGQHIDYGMDPDIVYHDARYKDLVGDSLLAVPTVSLVTELDNLFDAQTGIYVNALNYGREWERPVSFELIYPDGTVGFSVNAGLRIRGGWSRNDACPKHSFRLYFRSEYGHGKLRYPLFGNEGTDEFDKIDFRTAQNYSWSYSGDSSNTMVREVFARDLQKMMGQPYTRSRYYHLYVNGQYWGLYMSHERSEADFAETYFGGDKDDYDVVKANAGPLGNKQIEVTDGSLEAFEQLFDLAMGGFGSDEAYYRAQGLNPDGSANENYPRLLDSENLIDYMISIYFTGDKDAPISNFFGNRGLNNFYGIYNRNAPDGFKYFRHDAEHSLDKGLDDRTGPFLDSNFNSFIYFNPQTLHQKLMAHRDYRILFADRVYEHFFNDGVMTQSSAVSLIEARAAQIETAIIAESARWGDAQHSSWSHTKDDDWIPAVNVVKNYFAGRVGVVMSDFRNSAKYPNKWYPGIDPPVLNTHSGEVPIGFGVIMSNPNGSGTILYTLDGTDPRLPGGAINTSHALDYFLTGPAIIQSDTIIRARILDDGQWSALHLARFTAVSN